MTLLILFERVPKGRYSGWCRSTEEQNMVKDLSSHYQGLSETLAPRVSSVLVHDITRHVSQELVNDILQRY